MTARDAVDDDDDGSLERATEGSVRADVSPFGSQKGKDEAICKAS